MHLLHRLASYEQDLKAIADLRDEYVETLEDFIDLWVESGGETTAWREEILSTERRVREHALAIRGQAVLISRKLGLADIHTGTGPGKGEKKRTENLTDLISRYERYLKSGCLDMESFGVQELRASGHSATIEQEMESILGQRPGEPEEAGTAEVRAITYQSDTKAEEDKSDTKPEEDKRDNKPKEDRRDNNDEVVTGDVDEIITGSASSSVNIDAEDSSREGTKRISVRATRQNFFSIETFSPRYN
jgi:hypothetical protein